MVGITSYGAYIPMLRLSLAAIGGGKPGGPEKAVANWDEDGLTMAVAAAIACLDGVDRASVDGVLFASTSYAFKEKQGAAIVAKALDLRRDVLTADVGDSLRAGTTALRAAVAKLALYGPDARSHALVARGLGFGAEQVQDPLFGKVGNTGAAFAPLLLAAALASARPGDRLLVVGYGDGADALVFDATPAVTRLRDRRGVAWHLARRAELAAYEKYLRFRQLLATEHDRRAGAGIPATIHFRDRDEDVRLLGHRCRRCGTMQYPLQRVCYRCY